MVYACVGGQHALARTDPVMHVGSSSRPALASAGLTCLAVAGLVLTFWIFARTPVQPVSDRVEIEMLVLSLFLAGGMLLLAAAALLHWFRPEWSRAANGRYARRLPVETLPPWVFAMPVSLSASWVAARLALTNDPAPDYWPAFALWILAMVLLLASFVPLKPVRLPRVTFRRIPWAALVRSEVIVIALLTAGALALRAVDLSGAPVLVHGDEEQIGLEALRAANGDIKNMFAVAWGANPSMSFFVYGVFLKVFGADIVSARLASAVWGAAAVPMLYLLLREMFGRWTALTGALFLLGYHFHLHMSRVGINVVWDTTVMAAAMYFAFRASRDGRAFDFAATGLVCGLALYFYHGTRAVPIVVGVYLIYVGLFRWSFVRANLANITLLGLAFLVAALPLGAYWVTHQDAFWSRLDEASIFKSGWFGDQQDLGRSGTSIMWGQFRHAFGGWFYYTDQSPSALYTVPKPLVQGIAVIPLIAGLVYALLHIEDRRYALLLVGFAVPTFLGGVLTLGPPTGQRLLGAVPAVVGLMAVGIWQLSHRLFWWQPVLVGVVALTAAAGLAAMDGQIYFDAARNDVRWGHLVNSVAVKYFNQLPPDTRIYLYGYPNFGGAFSPLSLHGHPQIDVSDATPGTVKPVTQASPAVYVFLAHREARLPAVELRCPGGFTRPIMFHEIEVLTVYELTDPNTCIPTAGAPDDFEDALLLTSVRLPVTDYTVNQHAGVQPAEARPCGMSGNTVWYAFTPAEDVILVADSDGSTFDTVLAAYAGPTLDSLTLVSCNDDSHDVRSKTELPATGGETYYFQVGKAEKGRALAETDVVRFNLDKRPRCPAGQAPC